MADKQPYRHGVNREGGVGTRLHLATAATSKQLSAGVCQPMICYLPSTLMLTDIRNIT